MSSAAKTYTVKCDVKRLKEKMATVDATPSKAAWDNKLLKMRTAIKQSDRKKFQESFGELYYLKNNY
jgi:hypothetical protein